MALTGVTTTTVTTNDAMFDAADTVWTPTSGPLSAAYALLYNSTDLDSPPLFHYDFGGTITATLSPLAPFTITWNALGIGLLTVA
jgi:hypothetical protein